MFRKYLAVACLSLLPFSLRAWGVVGHRAIGRIAENHLTDKAKREVVALLGPETLPLVSTYPDEIRSDPAYKYTAPWHYLDTTHNLPYAQYVATIDTIKEPNAYLALQQMIAQLKDPSKSKADRVFALKFIVHLVGDVHQPMHAGHSEDQGGNKVAVKFLGRDQNLHSLWDSGLIDYEGLSYPELAQAHDHASKAQIQQWQRDPMATWLFESYQLSEPLYAEAAQNSTFDYRYFPVHAVQLDQRLLQAGIRLAGVLNQIFG
ncbi:S1/P1 nuclease [Hymenobacter nivis]|uniref:S1/P1 Nuclease n=1 Tax=Hymenobacter nivis TaxID=1850093 RepID=A0A502GZ75_9BACT|nr:S1/P1 nuclease [Hymenobacter nivis]TPG66376.1 S1/P1 Nuclease [Hymenobacter nivis]